MSMDKTAIQLHEVLHGSMSMLAGVALMIVQAQLAPVGDVLAHEGIHQRLPQEWDFFPDGDSTKHLLVPWCCME